MSSARITRTPEITVTGRTTGILRRGRAGEAIRGLGARGGRGCAARRSAPVGAARGGPLLRVGERGADRPDVVGGPDPPGGPRAPGPAGGDRPSWSHAGTPLSPRSRASVGSSNRPDHDMPAPAVGSD